MATPDAARDRTALIVRNPRARRVPSREELQTAARPLQERGWTVRIEDTNAPAHAIELAAKAAENSTAVVVACGGDGTVHEAANGLVGSSTALWHIPGGTANVWASEAGIPRSPARALAMLPGTRRARIDLGTVELPGQPLRHFLLMCSVGIDAEVVRRVGAGGRWKRSFGRAIYASVGIRTALRARTVPATLTVDGETLGGDLLMAVAGNTRAYGGVVRLTGAALANDGLLDLCTFTGNGIWHRARLAGRALRGGLDRRAGRGVSYRRGVSIEVTAERPLAVQADGEYLGQSGGAGDSPVRIGIDAASLDVLLAPGPNPLLGESQT